VTTRAIISAIVYFGLFLLIGWAAKKALDRWTSRNGSLSDLHKQAGPNRRPRDAFLLGVWRKEE
jgi:hypothetical protein